MEAKWKQLEKMMKKMKTAKNNVSLNENWKHVYNFSNILFTKNLCTQFKKFALLTLFIFVEEVVKREVCRQCTL